MKPETHDELWARTAATSVRLEEISRDMERRLGVDRRVPSTLSKDARNMLARLLREERRQQRRRRSDKEPK